MPACGWMWDPKKSRCWQATFRGWRGTLKPDSKLAGEPPRTSRSFTLRKKSRANTGPFSKGEACSAFLINTERFGFRSHPHDGSREFPWRQADQVGFQHD